MLGGPLQRERGFTLIELLIAMVIMPLVVGALAVMLLSVFRLQGSVSNRITGAANSQISSATLERDVQNAAFVTTQSTPACGALGTQILGLRSQSNQINVSYVRVANGSNYSLFRQLCTGGVTTTPVGSTLLSNNVPASQAASVSCTSTISCTYASGWIATAGVTNVTISVSETSTGAVYSLAAAPRLWTNVSGGYAADPFPFDPLYLLGSGTCPQTVLSLSGAALISVSGGSGAIMDNSICSPSIVMSGSAVITAAAIGTADPTPAASISRSGAPTAPTPVFQVPTGDPLGSLAAPATPTAVGTGTCPASGTSGNCTPGNFASAVSLGGSSNVTFGAGTYVFAGPVTVSASAAATFSSGTYVFQQGLTISGASPVMFNSGTYIFSGATSGANALNVTGSGSITSGPGGTLFYVKSGVISFSGAGRIALAGETQFDGVALWQASTDANSITLSGSSAVNAAYGGIYAPNAQVIPSGAAVVAASFVIANSVNFSGSAALYVG